MSAFSNFLENEILNHVLRGNAGKTVEDCEDAWGEVIDADVTSGVDTADKKSGTASVKLTVAGTATAGDILATEAITSTDISKTDKIAFWIKSSVATASGDLQLLLDDTAGCASPVYALNVPALTAGVWQYVEVSYDPSLVGSTAIISVGLKLVTDLGLADIWIDDIKTITTYYQPSTIHVSLHTADPTDAGTGAEVIKTTSTGVSTAYARQTVSFNAPSAGTLANSADVIFPVATADWGTITHIGLWDGSSTGNLLYHGALTTSKVISTDDQLVVSAGSLTVSLD